MSAQAALSNPITATETSMDAAADPVALNPTAPLPYLPSAGSSLPHVVSTGGSGVAADGCTHGANAAAAANRLTPAAQPKVKSSGFLCCLSSSSTADDGDVFTRVRGGNGATPPPPFKDLASHTMILLRCFSLLRRVSHRHQV